MGRRGSGFGVIVVILPARLLEHTYCFNRRGKEPSAQSKAYDLRSRCSEIFHILWTASAHQAVSTAHL